MSTEFTPSSQAEFEARLTALLLGELTGAEAAALRQSIEEDAELAALYERLKKTIMLVREVAAHPAESVPATGATAPLKLSEERRQKLLAQFKTVRPKEFAPPPQREVSPIVRLLQVAAVLTFLVVLAGLFLPALAKSKAKAVNIKVASNLKQIELAKQLWAADNNKSDGAAPTMKDLEPYLGRGAQGVPSVGGETYLPGKVGESPTAELDADKARKVFGRISGDQSTFGGRLFGKYFNPAPQQLARVTLDGKVALVVTNFTQRPAEEAQNSSQQLALRSPEFAAGKPAVIGRFPADHSLKDEPAAQPTDNLSRSAKPQIYLPTDNAPATPPTRQLANDQAAILNNTVTVAVNGGGSVPAQAPNDALQNSANTFSYYISPPALAQNQAAAANAQNEPVNRSQSAPLVDPATGLSSGQVNNSAQLSYQTQPAPLPGIDSAPQSIDHLFEPQIAAESGRVTQPSAELMKEKKAAFLVPKDPVALGQEPVQQTESASIESLKNVEKEWNDSARAKATLGSNNSAQELSLAQPISALSSVGKPAIRADLSDQAVLPPPKLALPAGVLPDGSVQQFSVSQFKSQSNDSYASTNGRLDFFRDGSLDASSRKKLYDSKKNELEQLAKQRDLLAARSFQEKVDVNLPKTSMVEIIEHAEAQPAPSPTLSERIGSAFGGQVERKARIKVERDAADVAGVSDRAKFAEAYDPNFVQSESEVIQSEPVLDKVVEKLNLDEKWADKNGGKKLSKAEARQMLKQRLDLKAEKNTGLFDIGAKGDTPEEAAQLAEATAEAFKDYRKQQRTELTLGGIKQYEKQAEELDREVSQKQAELKVLGKDLDSTNGQPDNTDTPLVKPAAPAPEPQPEVLTSTNAFSTFSLNIADVSFKLAAASLEKGVMPESASIRSEEFINAFDYRDPEAPPGVPVAFAWERARYPFAQNRDLLRFSLKTAATGRAPGRPLNIVLLLDNSGSMERADRVQIIREALRVLASQLQPQDTLSIVTFARTATLVIDGWTGSNASNAVERVIGLTPQGGTNLEEAMRLAYETALRHYLANGVNRVVLLTDGAANLGNVDPAALKAKVEMHRKQGIALDCFGIGWEGYNDDLLEVLARNGDGRYGFLNSPEEAANGFAHQLAGALNVAAADVKVQVEFNPQRVTVYRQIGYAKLQLTKEQFRDNTVDAAEIGAAEAGNALYVLQVDPNGQGPLGTVRVRYKIPGTEEFHEHEWSVPYTGNAVSLEQASPAMRLAATASAFSEWLANSPYAAEVTPDALLKYLSGVPAIYEPDARPKQLEWMIRQAKSVSGK